jgi:hypothetical protein
MFVVCYKNFIVFVINKDPDRRMILTWKNNVEISQGK